MFYCRAVISVPFRERKKVLLLFPMSDDESYESTKAQGECSHGGGSECDCWASAVRQSKEHPVLGPDRRGPNVLMDQAAVSSEDEKVPEDGGRRAGAARNPKRKRRNRVRSRAWVGTLNHPTAEDREYYANVSLDQMSWLIVGDEVGAEGTPHLQMACRFNSQVDFSVAKSVFGRGKAHVEAMKGTIEQNVVYCSKEKLLMERGIRPTEKGQEAKAKLSGMVQQIKDGVCDRTIFESNPAMFMRYVFFYFM